MGLARSSIYMVLISLLFSVQASWADVTFPKDRLTIVERGGKRIDLQVEVASTPDQLTQGLMYRRTLAPDSGMIFDFHVTKSVAMWMKNTLIPLDMVFVTDEGVVAGVVENAIPMSLEIISSPVPVRSVLELAGGRVHALGIKAGDRVEFALFKK